MADYTLKRFDEMDAIMGGAFKRARSSLGVTSFGMQIVDMPPNADRYFEHDHTHDGQEEVYVVLAGGGELDFDGERVRVGPNMAIRVGPQTKRKVLPGDEGMRLLIIGGTPGAVYEAPAFTEVGAPGPGAG